MYGGGFNSAHNFMPYNCFLVTILTISASIHMYLYAILYLPDGHTVFSTFIHMYVYAIQIFCIYHTENFHLHTCVSVCHPLFLR